jgi:hypothetical protein
MQTVNVGHSIEFAIVYLDANGNPMLTTPTPDSPPAWSNAPSAPSVDSFTVAADGLTAMLTALAAGTDAVSLSVTVGGVAFSASISIEIDAAPQVLSSVAIQATVS